MRSERAARRGAYFFRRGEVRDSVGGVGADGVDEGEEEDEDANRDGVENGCSAPRTETPRVRVPRRRGARSIVSVDVR